jgi:uncharacterized protein YfdQ (DUF2303 family)
METDGLLKENIAATLARELPNATVILQDDGTGVAHVAVPKHFTLVQVDTESREDHPRRAKGLATMSDAESFIAFVNEFKVAGTAVWCSFDPASAQLSFAAVIDEHAPGVPGWRGLGAAYTPRFSIEWQNWKGSNTKPFGQVEFADFLEKNESDVALADGMPTSLQMLAMATEFVAKQDMSIKSAVRLQDGGVRLSYIADSDAGTLEAMKLFEKFQIGIPVFWTTPKLDADGASIPLPAFRINARLKYRIRDGKVTFWYELIRPDRVHQAAAVELIDEVRKGIGEVPLRIGSFI